MSVSAGGGHTCAVLSVGTVSCWGDNQDGDMGPDTPVSDIPVPVPGVSGAVSISANMLDTCASLADGTVECWGWNYWGQLGNGSTADSAAPVLIDGLSGFSEISSGYYDTCALATGGVVWCWGMAPADGRTTMSATPVPVS